MTNEKEVEQTTKGEGVEVVTARDIANEIIIAVGKDPRYYPVTVSKAMADVEKLLSQKQQSAREGERERCASKVEEMTIAFNPEYNVTREDMDSIRQQIVFEIRKGVKK